MWTSNGAFRLAKKKGNGMNPCEDCLYYRICMERRGICTEYKTLEMIRNEIRMLNENQTPPAVRAVPADEGDI